MRAEFITALLNEYDHLWNQYYHIKRTDRFVLWYEIEETVVYFIGTCQRIVNDIPILKRNVGIVDVEHNGSTVSVLYFRYVNFRWVRTILLNNNIEVIKINSDVL